MVSSDRSSARSTPPISAPIVTVIGSMVIVTAARLRHRQRASPSGRRVVQWRCAMFDIDDLIVDLQGGGGRDGAAASGAGGARPSRVGARTRSPRRSIRRRAGSPWSTTRPSSRCSTWCGRRGWSSTRTTTACGPPSASTRASRTTRSSAGRAPTPAPSSSPAASTSHVGDTIVLGDDVIHSVANPVPKLTGAIHVYGGDFVNQPRSQWGPGPRRSVPTTSRTPTGSSPPPTTPGEPR